MPSYSISGGKNMVLYFVGLTITVSRRKKRKKRKKENEKGKCQSNPQKREVHKSSQLYRSSSF